MVSRVNCLRNDACWLSALFDSIFQATLVNMRKHLLRYTYSTILLKELVRTDFKLRYQGSVLGYLWSLLRPLFMFVILYFVFIRFLKIGHDVPHAPVYLLLGILLWNYFSEVTTGSVSAIVGKGDLLRKINFPKYVIVLAVAASATINLTLNFVIVGVFLFINHVSLSWHALYIFPLLVELFVLSLGVAFLLSALFVRLRDISYIWDVFIQAGFYITPIFYLLDRLPLQTAKLIILSPIAQIVQDARYAIVTQQSTTVAKLYGGNWRMWLIPVLASFLVLIFGFLYFRKRSYYFAEEV